MAKEIKKIGLNELELTNDDIFVRKTVTDFGKDDVVIVHETHSAMLLKDGKLQDTLEAGRYPLFEIQKKFFGLVKEKTDTEVDLIYVSKTAELPVRWGTPTQFTFRDPLTGIPARVGASGEFGVKVKDPVMLYKVLIGASREFSVEDLRNRLRARMPQSALLHARASTCRKSLFCTPRRPHATKNSRRGGTPLRADPLFPFDGKCAK